MAKLGRPTKYDQTITPNIENIIEWLSKGVPERDIAKNLNVSYSAWQNWKRTKKEFQRLFDNIVTKPRVEELENTMYKLSMGYTEIVKKTVKCKETYYDEQNRKCEREVLREYDEQIIVPPNYNALRFLLCNWDKTYSNDPALIRQRKEEFEHKKMLDEKNNW